MYEAKVRISVDDKQLSISEFGRDLTKTSTTQDANPIATQAELARSQRVLEEALVHVSFQGVSNLPELGAVKNDLKVSIVPATGILEMSYRSQNPELTPKLLNAVAEAMIQVNAESFRLKAGSVRGFLEAEVPKKRDQLTRAEAALSQYKQSQGIISLSTADGQDSSQMQGLVGSLTGLEEQERALSAQLQEARVRDSSLGRTTASGNLKNTYAAVRSGQDEELKSLRATLAELESELSVSRTRLTDNHPALASLIEKRDATRSLYRQKLSRLLPNNTSGKLPASVASDQVSQDLALKLILGETERSGLEAKLAVVRRNRAQLQSRLNQFPAKEQNLSELLRRRNEAASSVELLQGKLEEARVAEAELTSNISIIDRATKPSAPNWPSKPGVLVIATAAGIILAIGAVLLIETLDVTLRNSTEVSKLVKLPMLGVLPILPTPSLSRDRVRLFLDDSRLVEPYRALLKTIEFRSIEDLRVVVVSSALSGEGKSIVVSHLAAVSAILSRHTLIIDADLHRASQHELFDLVPQPGLADVIEERLSLAQAVQPTGIENLSVLTCGQSDTRSSQLLESARMRTVLAEAANHFDLVMVDTSPVTSTADATTLSHSSDGLLLVVRPNFTPRDILLQAVSELVDNQVRVLGVTLNGMNSQTEKYYRYPAESYQPHSKQLNHLPNKFKYVD